MRRSISPAVLVAAAGSVLLLAGCGSPADAPSDAPSPPAPPAVLAGVDLSEPVRVLGTEPFWAIELTGREMVYSGLDRPEQRAPQPQPDVQGTVARFEAETAAGTAIELTLAATECSDGMSDRVYPLTAIAKVGQETLNGCAASAAAIANAGESGRVG